MGLLQRTLETYENHENLVGRNIEGKIMLAPIAHDIKGVDLEITLDEDGDLVDAVVVDKKDRKTTIPVSEESSKRTSQNPPPAHPLTDKLSYYLPKNKEKYHDLTSQLEAWANSEFGHPKLMPILTYLRSGTILDDLISRESIRKALDYNEKTGDYKKDLMIRWRVYTDDDKADTACWRDETLFKSYIDYYFSTVNTGNKKVCMISGRESRPTDAFPKSIGSYSNPKIISANDKDGATFRGRFANADQALSVSDEAVQKSHNALNWLINNSKNTKFGDRTYICWNPQGLMVPAIASSVFGDETCIVKPSDYKKVLWNKLAGYKAELPDNAEVVIAALDPPTKGRLSVVYYNELKGSDFLARLLDWDEHCCWYTKKFGIQSPHLQKIVEYAYGIPRHSESGKLTLEVKNGVLGTQMERLIDCRINKAHIPQDLVRRLVENAAYPERYKATPKDKYNWRDLISTACAVINKYLYERNGENAMEWSLDYLDRSFQFGRLLAAIDHAEQECLRRLRANRQTNAMTSMAVYRRRPITTFEILNTKLELSYLRRSSNSGTRNFYEKNVSEIMALITECSDESTINKPLDPIYLIGYEMQKRKMEEDAAAAKASKAAKTMKAKDPTETVETVATEQIKNMEEN